VTIEEKNTEEKVKKDPDVEIRTRLTVEACATRIEGFADSNGHTIADVALLPQDGQWSIEITREYSDNPFSIMYFKHRFRGYLQRTEAGGAMLVGDIMPDVATYVTRGLYLVLLGPPMIFVALRLGFRFPFIWLIVVGLLGLMLYMLAWHPDKVNEEKKPASS
jgi:hypothetical protein